ncbi:MAG: GNAT family N-acetyltransferase [Patescibacteria group bacterium]
MKKSVIVELGIKDIFDILALEGNIEAVFSSYADWRHWFSTGTKTWGIKDGKKLIAIGSISFYDNQGDLCDLKYASVAMLTNGEVHPIYRGLGYQLQLIDYRIKFNLNRNIYNIQSLVKEGNEPSIKNLQRSGFVYSGVHCGDEGISDKYVYHLPWWVLLRKILSLYGTRT